MRRNFDLIEGMARKPRLEFAGALYHVMNRGNYRQDLFNIYRTGESFENALFDACERFGWRLHAYCILSNHFHLALETIEPNLQIGMQWLQSTFANRFNKFAGQQGHVFQGRYKALVIEPGQSLLRVVNYIHLNPVRAGLLTVADLRSYPLSSFPRFFRKKWRPKCLTCALWLAQAGGWSDSAKGLGKYRKYLSTVDEGDPRKRENLWKDLCKGWLIGNDEYGKQVLQKLTEKQTRMKAAVIWSKYGEVAWTQELKHGLKILKKGAEDIPYTRKCEEWKIALAAFLKSRSAVGNGWLSKNLNLGSPAYVSANINAYNRLCRKRCPFLKLLTEKQRPDPFDNREHKCGSTGS